MTIDLRHWNDLEGWFNELVALPKERRTEWLEENFGSDDLVRGRLEQMLCADEEPDSLFQVSRSESPGETIAASGGIEPSKKCMAIGPYRLLEQIGEGGFGVVYMAEQRQPVRRKVALKIIKPGMDSRAVVARFEAERQALAMMDHPNVAKILDGGVTNEGTPYFVMDLVRGKPLTEFCDLEKLSTRERLELFIPVLRAIEHAHQKGIIHRDIKPSNVMVTLHDNQPVPRVIDFGIAKALHSDLTDKTLFTGFAAMVGTPQYMSPEQASMSGLDVDIRSDVYSLGVLLYELLAGRPPFDSETLREAGLDGMRHVICEREPAKPSAMVSTLDGDTMAEVVRYRRTEPQKLSRILRGELDWIIMKAIEKDRNRRYSSVGDFADDVRSYLDDQTVSASPPSFRYRMGKLIRRNRGLFASAVTILTVMSIGIVTSAASLWTAQNTQRRLVDRLVQSTLESNSSQIETSVQGMRPIRGASLAELSKRQLDDSLTVAERANVLIAVGQLDETANISNYLLDQIGSLEGNYAPSLIDTLQKNEAFDPTLLVLVANQAERNGDLRAKSRLAVLGLHLGKPEIAEDMFRFGVDPIQRTRLLLESQHWFADNRDLLNLINQSDGPEFRSGVIQLVGMPKTGKISQEVKNHWIPWLEKHCLESSDLLTKNSCQWLLRRWGQTSPESPTSSPSDARDWFVNSVGMTMRRIEPAQFTMGSWTSNFKLEPWDAYFDETPRQVKVTRPFWIADRELTANAFIACAKEKLWTIPFYDELSGDEPATIQNWVIAMRFCNWLSKREGLQECYFIDREVGVESPTRGWTLNREANGYRLPTEAEWELACRGETITDYSWGQAINATDLHVGSPGTAGGISLPNPNGLFDMHGKLLEICEDQYGMYPINHSLTETIEDPCVSWGSDRATTRGYDPKGRLFRSSSRSSIGLTDAVLGDEVSIRLVRTADDREKSAKSPSDVQRERMLIRAARLNDLEDRGPHLAELAIIELRRENSDACANYFNEWLDVVKPYEDYASLRTQVLTHLSAHQNVIERLHRLRPADAHLQLCRARHAGFLGKWNDAAKFSLPILRQRDGRSTRWKGWMADQEWHEMSSYLLLAGQTDDYEKYRSWMLRQIDNQYDERIDWTILKASTLAPNSNPAEQRGILRIAQRNQEDWGDAVSFPPHAFAFFRAERLSDAVRFLSSPGFANQEKRVPVVLAMAKWETGDREEAIKILKAQLAHRSRKPFRRPSKWPNMFHWWDATLSHEVFLREAIELTGIDVTEIESETTESAR
ncbi:MAG: bifunctional serine/threonine-protein kinase/formylglycine-generating enzyme family protein [Planctomycetota bacterium]